MIRRSSSQALWSRLYRISLGSAVVLMLPILVGIGWYSWSTFVRFERYRRAASSDEKLTVPRFQWFLHDEFDRHLRRLRLPDPPEDSKLQLFEISIAPKGMTQLAKDSGHKKKRSYVEAYIRTQGKMHECRVRHQGRRHWHSLGVQKSMKVRVEKGELISGVRVFNLLNDVTPFGLEEQIILDLSRELGLLAPEFRPVRVRLNNHDVGVYRFEAQPDEGLLRRAKRMPGGMYSGEFEARCVKTETSTVPKPPCGWIKSASRAADDRANFKPIAELTDVLYQGTHEAFRRFAKRRLDLSRFALFEALDIVFGGEQHDFASNQKLYFDAYRGRFEPIARDFRAFTHDRSYKLSENALQARLAHVPEYLALRDRAVYGLLTNQAAHPTIRARVDAAFTALRAELESDPYWDAYKLLPRTSKFARQAVRPMNRRSWLLSAEKELATYARRTRFLLDLLEAPSLAMTARRIQSGVIVELDVSRYGAYRLGPITVEGPGQDHFQVFADRNLNGLVDDGEQALLGDARINSAVAPERFQTLTSGVEFVGEALSELRQSRTERTYRFVVLAPKLEGHRIRFSLTNEITGAVLERTFDVDDVAEGSVAATAQQGDAGRQVARFAAGEASVHPWAFAPRDRSSIVQLGPGPVTFAASTVFPAHEKVYVAPGTQLRLHPGVSLTFEGQVTIDGFAHRPVEVVRAREGAFGGLFWSGPGTRGSRIRNLRVRGGGAVVRPPFYAPSAIVVYDTENVSFSGLDVADMGTVEDVVHATYVDGLTLSDIKISRAFSDALDIEHSRAIIRRLQAIGAGDECFDVMTSDVDIADSILVDCQNNAISAGEASKVRVQNVLIAGSKVGVLSKNASRVRVVRSVIARAKHALRTNRKDVHYAEDSSIDVGQVHAIGCENAVKRAKGTRLDTRRLHITVPRADQLRHLREQVLRLDRWEGLEALLAATRSAAR